MRSLARLRFEIPEFEIRLKRVKEAMQRQGIEVLISEHPANINYLTGYDGHSFYTHQMTVVMLDEEQPFWIGRMQDMNGARLTTYLDEKHLLSYPETHVQSEQHHPMEFVADMLRQQKRHRSRIGYEGDSVYFTAASYRTLCQYLPDATLVDVHALLNHARAVKSEQEIEYIRQAGRITDKTMQMAQETIRPGMRQCDLAAEIYRDLIRGTEDYGGDYPAIVPLMPTGEGTSAPHLTWSDEPFGEEGGTVIEISGARYHYHCPLTRTVFLGTPSDKVKRMADVVDEGVAAALDVIRPGIACEEVEAAWRHSIARHGVEKKSRVGYPIGLGFPPDWGEQSYSLRPGDKTILQPGMTAHLMAGVWMEDWGVSFSETFLVTEDGVETFSELPRKLLVK